MNNLKLFLIGILTASTLLVVPASPASANHNSCATHDVPAVATGTVSATNTDDWWSHQTTIPVTTYTITMSGGDADLYVYGPDSCSAPLACSSLNFGSVTDSCRVIGAGKYFVDVAWFSGTSVSYTLTITSP